MLNWYEHLYVGETVKKNIIRYKRMLNRKKVMENIYLITIASNGIDQLDIIHNYYLLQETLYRRCPMIVGIAGNRNEAKELVVRMTEDAFCHTKTGDVKKYLLQG